MIDNAIEFVLNAAFLYPQMYRVQAVEMGFEEFHMFLRCVQFEFANHKDDADQPPPLFMTALQEDDSSLDRYTPANLFLAIQELDEKHVGMFSFRSKDGCLKVSNNPVFFIFSSSPSLIPANCPYLKKKCFID